MLFKNIAYADESYTLQTGGYIATQGNRITYIGSEAPAEYTGDVFDGQNHVALPGFFNAHCHVPMVLLRGFGEGLPLQRWLEERMFPFEDLLTADDMYWGSLLGIAEMLASGCVSFTDMYMEVESLCRAVQESGIKANLCHGATGGADTHYADTWGGRATQSLMQYMKSAPNDRILADVGIHAEYTSDALICREAACFAEENGMRIHTHISETRKEHEECKQRRGMTVTQWFLQNGVLEVPASVAHCVWVEDEDMDILAAKGATVGHCPSSNLKLGSGIARVKTMVEKGVRVAIGTDGAASNNNLNVLEEVSLASLLQKGATMDPLFMGTAQTLEMACRNGALGQGRTDCGALKVGNRADIVLYDLDGPALQPRLDVLSNVLYSAQANAVALTMVDGEVVYENGEYKNIDIEKVKYHAGHIANEKVEKLGL